MTRRQWTGAAIAAVIVAVLVIVLFHGASITPAGPAAGDSLRRPAGTEPTAASAPARFATFNIHTGEDRSDREDLGATAEIIGGAAFVGLNEVTGSPFGSPQNQAQELASRLKMGWLFAPTERRWWSGSFGNGVLSRLPVSSWLVVPLPGGKDAGYRNAVLARVHLGPCLVNVLNTHLARGRDRAAQLQAVVALFLSLAEPAVLLGDLNTTRKSSEMQRLLATAGVEDPLGMFGERSTGRVDWILTRGMKVFAAGQVEGEASDHPFVWADLGCS